MFKPHHLNLSVASFFLIQILLLPHDALAEDKKVFKTDYTDIFYSDDKALRDFFWRISGAKFDFTGDSNMAKSRVDRIIDRVRSVLDMNPDNLHIKINLYPQYKEGLIASYSHDTKSVTVYADRVTDGILAHEIAHAIICNYFIEPPPEKIQEILAQYVDRHLWSDY